MFMRGFLSIFLNAIALILVSNMFDSFHLDGFGTALLASFILAVLNTVVKPVLVVLTLPITVISLGLFLFIINALTLMITQSVMGPSFVIDGFGTAIIAAMIISVINLILNKFVKDTLRY
ncbi:MAG TPA: phage holin family protein [Cerasibacillus sp.]|uniref:phage holin family protein n=1 Tax=Cerasibacillus sp. TaxID=2498711 RepID=UPI002F3F0E89